MITITEDYCDYVVTKMLIERGFNSDWVKGAKPTIQMALKFLRVVYGLNIIVIYGSAKWCYAIHDIKNKSQAIDTKDGFETYDRAIETALINALDSIKVQGVFGTLHDCYHD